MHRRSKVGTFVFVGDVVVVMGRMVVGRSRAPVETAIRGASGASR